MLKPLICTSKIARRPPVTGESLPMYLPSPVAWPTGKLTSPASPSTKGSDAPPSSLTLPSSMGSPTPKPLSPPCSGWPVSTSMPCPFTYEKGKRRPI